MPREALFAGVRKLRARARLARAARRYSRSRGGNVIILYSFLFSVLMLFVGGAVDFTRYNAVHADLVESLDAAGLAIAQIDAMNGPDISSLTGADRIAYLKTKGVEFFNENFKHAGSVQDLHVDFDINSATITPRVTGTMKTLFLGIGQTLMHGGTSLSTLSMATDTEITRHGAGKIELALVLDQTGSMAQTATSTDTVSKIASLKTAVGNLLDTLYGSDTVSANVKVGVVPFNAYVNPGAATSWQSTWGDLNALSYYHGAHFVRINDTGTIDTSTLATAVNPNGVAKVWDPATKVNHYDLYNSVTGESWAGCVEARPYPLDELDTEAGQPTTSAAITDALQVPSDLTTTTSSYQDTEKAAFTEAPGLMVSSTVLASADNSRWVPLFNPDEPNCDPNNTACNWGDPNTSVSATYTMGGSSRTAYGYGYWFTDPDSITGMSESAYSNRKFILDQYYTLSTAGAPFARYLDVVDGFQLATGNDYASLDNYWQSVKTQLGNLGAKFSASAADQCTLVTTKKHGQTTTETRCTTFVTPGDEYILRNAYVGWWNPLTNRYTGKYDQSPSIATSSNGDQTRGPNKDCPKKILPLTNDRTLVDAEVNGLQPYGNTNSANGMIWGVRVLSPQAPFTEGVSYTDADWTKAVVLMTDGQNTASAASTPWKSDLTAYGYALEERMGVGINTAPQMRDEYDQKLLRICHRAKDQGIVVYTIIFGLDDANLENVFKSCATKPIAPYYYKAPSAADLQNAFGDIAQDLVKLHVSK
ncbi:MAG TPA: hypothetical protein VNH64_01955 [Parvularculaceae bacterium]|nr:hypothetical protein [Parvularculaceae bacterium]